ncbi:MAG TPA: YoaK family protein [Pseudolabrys sp.]|nr:YoaK family protein [Pseudolabrys sp.]
MSPPRVMPPLLAFVAGAVDAVTFLALFGLFVAQVTGSFVTVGAQIVTHDPAVLIRILAIPLFFIAGAAVVFVVETREKSPATLALCLTIELALLTGLMVVGLLAAPFPDPNAPAALLAASLGLLAMGLQSAMVRLVLHGVASTNVMTTNTTQFAIDVAEWLIAAWRSRGPAATDAARAARTHATLRVTTLGPIMAGFVTGCLCGAVAFVLVGFWCLLGVIAIIAGLIACALRTSIN